MVMRNRCRYTFTLTAMEYMKVKLLIASTIPTYLPEVPEASKFRADKWYVLNRSASALFSIPEKSRWANALPAQPLLASLLTE